VEKLVSAAASKTAGKGGKRKWCKGRK